MSIINNIEINYTTKFVDYNDSIKFMEDRVSAINLNIKKELIWFLYHDNIYTIGSNGNIKEIRAKLDIPLFKTNRGGKITYHGPGQRIIYFLINLNNRKKDIRKFVNIIESSAIKVLNDYNIESRTFPNRVGIWVIKNNGISLRKEKKIGAIGLRIKKWVTYHGLSFNINTDLKYYEKIDACGLKDYSSTSMEALGIFITNEEFDLKFLKYFLEELDKLK